MSIGFQADKFSVAFSVLSASAVSENIGSIHGAGIYLEDGSTCEVSDTSFAGNTDDEDTWMDDLDTAYTWGEEASFVCDDKGCE